MSGFSDEAFSLDALRDVPLLDAAEAIDLSELHRALLSDGCLEELERCNRELDLAIAELDALDEAERSAPSESSPSVSGLRASSSRLPEIGLDHL